MALAIAQTGVEDSTGTTITFTDISNWIAEGLNKAEYVRTFTLTDENGELLDTIILPTDSDTATYAISESSWIQSVFTIVGAVSLTNTTKYPFFRIDKNLYRELLAEGYSSNTANSLDGALRYFKGAEIEAVAGNGVQWKTDIDAAHAYLND